MAGNSELLHIALCGHLQPEWKVTEDWVCHLRRVLIGTSAADNADEVRTDLQISKNGLADEVQTDLGSTSIATLKASSVAQSNLIATAGSQVGPTASSQCKLENHNADDQQLQENNVSEIQRKYFHRYDLDDSGTINNQEELMQLSTNLVIQLALDVNIRSLQSVVERAGNIAWSFDEFKGWFDSTILPLQRQS